METDPWKIPKREPTAEEQAVMEEDGFDQMQRVATVQKGEIWELEIGKYKVTKALAGGKVIHLRRIKDADR